MSVTTLVAVGDDVEITGDPDACYPIYSVTKTAVAAAVLDEERVGPPAQLEVELVHSPRRYRRRPPAARGRIVADLTAL